MAQIMLGRSLGGRVYDRLSEWSLPERCVGFAVAVFCIGAASSACTQETDQSRTYLKLVTGPSEGAYQILGKTLAHLYSTKIPGVVVVAENTLGSAFNADAIQQGKADLGFSQADTAYIVSKRGSAEQITHVRGMAVLYVNTVQLFVRSDSPIQRVANFRGRRMAIGVPSGPTDIAARVILETHGLTMADVTLIEQQNLSMNERVVRVQNGSVEVGVFVTNYPVLGIAERDAIVDMRQIPLEPDAIARIRGRYLFYKPIVIPKGTYPNQTVDVDTIGIDTLLVCREDLPEELIYQLTKSLFESLPELAQSHQAAEFIRVEQGPTTSIPLHPGAARFYRELELKR